MRRKMAEWAKIESRNISGTGVLRLPSDVAKRRAAILYCSVYRKPRNSYLNRNYNPDRAVYGFATFSRLGYVQKDELIQYEKQSFSSVGDITSQNLIAIKCAYDGILQSFVNLVNGLSGTPGGIGIFVAGVEDKIKDYEYLDLDWTEVVVKCYGDTAINLQLWALPHDSCDPDKDKPKPPPPPDPPPPSVPPGTPLTNISPPYDDPENPDDTTDPYPDDRPPELPTGDACVEYDVELSWVNIDGRRGSGVFRVFGEIEGAGVGNEGRFLFITCRGGRDSIEPPAGACLESVADCAVIGSTEPDYASVTVVAVTPV